MKTSYRYSILIAATFAVLSLGISGCSEDTQQKWEKAGEAVSDAAKDTAKEAQKEAKKVIENAKATDPDTGLAK